MAAEPLANDELLLLKKRARRRLVGAVAFMMVALVVLSWVMESRPLPQGKSLVVAIDGMAPDTATRESRAFESPAGTQASAAVAASVAEASVSPAVTRPPAAAASDSSVAESIRQREQARKAADRRAAEARAALDAAKKTEKKPVSKPSAAKNGRHSASVVALSDAGKAAELQRKLKARGLIAYTETVEVGGKTLTRVRIGPYDSSAELEKARAKLALMGL